MRGQNLLTIRHVWSVATNLRRNHGMAQKNENLTKPRTAKLILGKQGEQLASDYLIREGFTIIKRNWRSGRRGELDLVAQDKDGTYVFIEVKTRHSARQSDERDLGFQAVDGMKQHRLVNLAMRFIMAQSLSFDTTACRFDVIVVNRLDDYAEGEYELLHVTNAFHSLSGWA
jgi:putative endonuclease